MEPHLVALSKPIIVRIGGGGYGGKSSDAGANLRMPDWSRIDLIPFQKDFYNEHRDVARLSEHEVRSLPSYWFLSAYLGFLCVGPLPTWAFLSVQSARDYLGIIHN